MTYFYKLGSLYAARLMKLSFMGPNMGPQAQPAGATSAAAPPTPAAMAAPQVQPTPTPTGPGTAVTPPQTNSAVQAQLTGNTIQTSAQPPAQRNMSMLPNVTKPPVPPPTGGSPA